MSEGGRFYMFIATNYPSYVHNAVQSESWKVHPCTGKQAIGIQARLPYEIL